MAITTTRPKPLTFSERTEQILPDNNNLLQMFMRDMENFATSNNMKINSSKTKIMKISRVTRMDFPLEISLSNKVQLEVVNTIKILGILINDRLKWDENTEYLCAKARRKIWLLRNMKMSGLTQIQLLDAYKKEVRSLLELSVPVWSSGITVEQNDQFERVQRSALSAILGPKYVSYDQALKSTNLERLSIRREKICIKFIRKNMKSDRPLLKVKNKTHATRSNPKFAEEIQCRTKAYFDSSVPYLARLYNSHMKMKSKIK